jgi:hypothetical protein
MASRRIFRGVVGNFLGTYVSRYTDYCGYWLFGFIVADLEEMQIDLLAPITKPVATAHDAAAQIAVSRFEDQVQKGSLAYIHIKEASLTIQRLSGSSRCCVNGRPTIGYNVKFSVRATIDNGRTYCHEMTITVAPHDAKSEGQSGRYNPLQV